MTDQTPESIPEALDFGAVMSLAITPVRYDPMDMRAEHRDLVHFADKLLTRAETNLEAGDLAGAAIQYGQALGVAAVLAQLDANFHDRAIDTSLQIQNNLMGIHEMLSIAHRAVFCQVGIDGDDPLGLNDHANEPEEN